ncbi:MAG TPA: hypothetical protein VFG23_05390 [Polyangia bacterium]|nr:hypothetical protein [Polyangia bacterium]
MPPAEPPVLPPVPWPTTPAASPGPLVGVDDPQAAVQTTGSQKMAAQRTAAREPGIANLEIIPPGLNMR